MARRGHGEGSIIKRSDGRWAAEMTVEGAKRKWFYGKTRREVQEKLTAALRDQQRGLSIPTGPQKLLGEFLTEWLENVARPSVRLNTYKRYRNFVDLHAVPLLGNRPLQKLSPSDLQSLYARKLAEGLSPRTVCHLHRVLHGALEQAMRWDLVARNVCDLVDPPKVVRPEMKVLNVEQAHQLLDAAVGDPLEALYVVALTTGLRQGELLGLKWQDLDLAAGRLQVRRSLARVDGVGFIEQEPKSAAGRRSIVLTPAAISALKAHRTRQLEERLQAGPEWEDHDLVFCNALGRPIEAGNLLRRSFWPLLEKAGIPRIRFHDLRHSAATLLLSLGTHPKIVQEMLGHSQISLTLDTYSHVLPTMQQEAVANLDRLLTNR